MNLKYVDFKRKGNLPEVWLIFRNRKGDFYIFSATSMLVKANHCYRFLGVTQIYQFEVEGYNVFKVTSFASVKDLGEGSAAFGWKAEQDIQKKVKASLHVQ